MQIDVTWQVRAAPGATYTTLVHLAEAGQPPLATGDRPPLNGQYPTYAWVAGEVIVDSYEVMVGEGVRNGRYPLWLGMYDSATIVRLPLTVQGEAQPNNVYLAGYITVVD